MLGEKDGVGRASVRCEGCKSNLRGSACPACGNWDQLLRRPHQHHQHQMFRRNTTVREKQPQPSEEGSGTTTAGARDREDGDLVQLARPRPMCTSCGHQPPESPGGDETPEEAFSKSDASLTGVVHEDTEAVAPVPAPAGPTATAPGAAATTSLAEGSNGDGGSRARRAPRVGETRNREDKTPPPPLATAGKDHIAIGDDPATPADPRGKNNSSPGPTAKAIEERAEEGGGEDETEGEEEEQATPWKAFASAPLGGVTSPDPGGLESNGATAAEKSNRHGKRQAGSGGTSSSVGSTVTAADDAAVEGEEEQPGVRPLPERGGVHRPGDRGDSEAPLPHAPVPSVDGSVVSRAVKPPPRSMLRRRGGRRPFVPRQRSPSSPPVVASAAEGAEAELAGWKARKSSETEMAEERGVGGGDNVEETAAVLLTPPSAEGADSASMTPPAENHRIGAGSRHQRDESARPASRNRGAGRRRRQKRLGSRSSSSSPSPRSLSSRPATTTPATKGSSLPGQKNRGSASDDHPPTPTPNVAAAAATDDDAAATAGCRVTFAAVPRESSPPPPPGIRIGGKEDGGETDGPGRGTGTGAKEMVHLAFCSRCQEYQSWRAPLSSGGWRRRIEAASRGIPAARRNCTECGDLYSTVSYYPAR